MKQFRQIANPGLAKSIIVHEYLVRDFNATAAILLSNIYFLCIKHGACTQSLLSMSIRTGITRNTVRKYVKQFVSLGLLQKHEADNNIEYRVGERANPNVISAYTQMLNKGKKSADTGLLISISLKDIDKLKGKAAEKSRFVAFFTSFCVDKFGSAYLHSDKSFAYFSIESVSKLARRFGITRQTLSKILKLLRAKGKLRLERYDGKIIIDFMLGLSERIEAKRKALAKQVFT